MIGVGQPFPLFSLEACVDVDRRRAFRTVSSSDFPGQWKVVFFWPMDFTFVCPTELVGFAKLNDDFADREAQLLGASTDSHFVHHAWRQHREDLYHLPYPMLADTKRELSSALGILDPHTGVAQRAVYIVDPTGIVRFVMVTDLQVGRNPEEVLRILDALQTNGLCGCNWQKGAELLEASFA
ncbi:MAG: peroxiredoxin [Bryobacterales bacterium]|jgi:peroxiredoxin (alkyl hydroperoxide reductase subunit C)|nr:peroxiredoxin [Bryobacterales bacterium]